MVWTNPPIVATGDFVTAALWNTYIRANGLHLRGLLPDAASIGQALVSLSATSGVWGQIGTAQLFDTAVTTAKLSDSAVTTAKIADSAATTNKINDGAVTTNKYADNSISTAKYIDGSVTTSKYADNSISTAKYIDGSITAAKLASGVGTVPSGLIAAFATAGAIASGWSRYTALDGRMPVGAGSTFSVTYNENTDYGSSWSHSHATTWTSHNHNASALGISGNTGNNSASGQRGGTGSSTADDPHTHGVGTLDVTGSTDDAGGGGSSSDAWVIPSRAVVWAQKA